MNVASRQDSSDLCP